ncbi:MAG TPA: CHAD domain-containing protein [Gammaproteobacteria bacterium]|nr:CHAD domain-containing protein [Gammaproteobacteria bacterium]
MARILEDYRQAIASNEVGVLEDTDIEALHDFRVAIRRTRTLLKFTGQIFGRESHRRFREDFSRLAKSTGELRDLDVFLSQWKAQTGRLRAAPAVLEPMRILLLRRRHLAYSRLVRLMRSPWYRRFKTAWRSLLARATRDMTHGGSAKVIADSALKTAFSNVIKIGDGLRRRGSIERLHELRKACKELRYLLEAFKGLCGKDRFAVLIKNLKNLQDNLGDICDFAIQQDIVRELRVRLTAEGRVALYPIMVRWAKWLRKRRDRARAHLAEHYDQFARKRNRKLFEAITRAARP